MKRIDYDQQLHQSYQDGRALHPGTSRLWMEAIARHVTTSHGLVVLDLGSGTGRFSRHLAEHFGARVIGVEPSQRMKAIAENENAHPRISYVDGCAEQIPVGGEECDFAFLSMVVHHVEDLGSCCRELCRVLKRGGRVFVRNSFRNRLNMRFYEFFPSAKRIDNERLPSIEETQRAFVGHGFDMVAFDTVRQQIDAGLQEHYERISKRALSTFEFISDEEFAAGLATMKSAADQETEPTPIWEDIDLLVFEKPSGV